MQICLRGRLPTSSTSGSALLCITMATRAGNSTERNLDCGTTSQVTDDEFVKKLLSRIVTDPKVSLWQHAYELTASLDIVRGFSAKLGFKYFVQRRHQLIEEVSRAKSRRKHSLSWLKKRQAPIIKIFSAKSFFQSTSSPTCVTEILEAYPRLA